MYYSLWITFWRKFLVKLFFENKTDNLVDTNSFQFIFVI